MRVIAGTYRSRRIESFPGLDLRPTADRLRETLFDVLAAGNRAALEGTVWLDLFAGTGAVGIEALSRGAGMVYFAESSKRAADLIAKNLRSLGIESGFQVLKQTSGRAVQQLASQDVQADFIFLDPPYRMEDEYGHSLRAIAGSSILKAWGVVIAEHRKKFDPGERFPSIQRFRLLKQGDAALSFYHRAGDTGA
jgi:16S rRNA (guanine966-N2)-methyltransferase